MLGEVLYATEKLTLTQTDRRKFEIRIWRIENINRFDKVTNEEVIRRLNEGRQILNSIWQRKHQWISNVLRHDGQMRNY